jgi:hypothetical protein
MNVKQTTKKAAMILAGSLMFAGSVGAETSFLSTFDDGSAAVNDGPWTGFQTYAYSENYTSTAPSGGGSHFAKTNDGDLTTTIDITHGGADTPMIAAGKMHFNFSAYLGSYTQNIDRAQISYQFLDAQAKLIGSATTFDDGLANVPNGTWTRYGTTDGAVPTNATSVIITIAKSASVGVAGKNDGYADLVRFNTTTSRTASKLTSSALLGIGGISLILRHQK